MNECVVYVRQFITWCILSQMHLVIVMYLQSGRLLVLQHERPACSLQMLLPFVEIAVLSCSLRPQHLSARVQHVSAGKRYIQLVCAVILAREIGRASCRERV